MRCIFVILSRVLLGITLSVGVIYTIVATEWGTRILLKLVQKTLPGQLSITAIKGKIISDLSLHDIHYLNHGTNLHVDDLSFSWSAWGLVHRTVTINEIHLNGARIDLPLANKNKPSSTISIAKLIDKLRHIHIAQFHIHQVDAFQVNEPLLHIEKMVLEDQENVKSLKVDGNVHGYPIHALANVTVRGNVLNIKDAQAVLGDAFLNITGKLGERSTLRWQLHIPNLHTILSQASGKLSGQGIVDNEEIKANLDGENIAFSGLPDATIWRAKVDASYHLTDMTTKAHLTEGEVRIKKLGLTLSEITLESHYKWKDAIYFDAHFKSGRGQGNLNGQWRLNEIGYPLHLTLTGERLQALNLAEYKITMSPDLSLLYLNQQLKAEGKIEIPEAKIEPKDFRNVVTLPKEVVVIKDGQEAVDTSELTNLSLDLQINLGEQVLLHYENLTAHLGGRLNIKQVPGSQAIGVGELYTKKGKYQAYDKSLKIEKGRLLYTGNAMMNPGLDIRASTRVKVMEVVNSGSQFAKSNELKPAYAESSTLVVGIWVKGTLLNPIVSLFSNPGGISQADILSYLIFGYPQSQISQLSSVALLGSVATNMHVGGNHIGKSASDLKKKLGITEFGISSTEVFNPNNQKTTNETMFSVGKKLGKRLYLRYSVGLFTPIQILNLKYQLSKRLAIQSETSTLDNGADLVYEFEKD